VGLDLEDGGPQTYDRSWLGKTKAVITDKTSGVYIIFYKTSIKDC
jgi:hypothetical protein